MNYAHPLPPWLLVAQSEAGVKTFPAGQSNPRITQYHDETNLRGYDDKASWCSSFVNWTFAQTGIAGTGSALARSWLDWGQPLQAPVTGCVVVLWRDDPESWKGHVSFFLRADDTSVFLFGGNQLAVFLDGRGLTAETMQAIAKEMAFSESRASRRSKM